MGMEGADLTQEVRTILIEPAKTVRHFSGDGEPPRAQEFAEQVRRAWASMPTNTTPNRKLDVIFENIGSTIKAELRCAEQDVRSDPDKTLDLILAVFGERRTPMHLRQLMEKERQLVGESVRDFSNRLMGLFANLQNRQKALNQPKSPESDLTEQFVTALADITLTRTLREKRKAKPEMTFREARQSAIDWCDDGLGQESNLVAAVAASRSESLELREMLAEQTAALKEMSQAVSLLLSTATTTLQPPRPATANPPRDIVCWNCRKTGHIQRLCPEAKAAGNAPPRL